MALAGLFTCSVGSPWHMAQPTLIGARESAFVPCLPDHTSNASAWQLAQSFPLRISSSACAKAVREWIAAHISRQAARNHRPPVAYLVVMLPPTGQTSAAPALPVPVAGNIA